ncbi:ribonuclease III [Candidatus Amesbacteria bacterium RIFCSPHIGHO2_02_FULL_47_9]|uniref:Ribonuclease 3 n=1 Tax=Candidatus Amesbacteria bacterium RIFCSPHIGHO2_01_FULL_48_32b TaxID=1797253 RepID=A0A1F4YFW9_9BACT|nr:MAG: ribonuclease III [Candidatus Amesbacteria bacterium RIFCSPHIGHO2_01_FULL_48_32b]OGD04242.1 MAG: ribonuclease III [Candidatus Amesbacteria bacterium RIFCSPHIGHO2_02_FULL_47_9]OGD07342.1 MAG: ribonuclease III [Candidatus Amesbacteria bacterium RIFCSPLOWO2_01_FULL_49_25]
MKTSLASFFKNQDNFKNALIHRSFCNEHPGSQSNERLEFLGDSILSLVISQRLYHLLPSSPEGELTAHRSSIVQTASLAAKAKELHLDQSIKLSRGEEDSGGRTNPKLLENTFEAVLGSLYLDSGLSTCEKLLNEVFPDSELLLPITLKDPKSLLQEKAQSLGWGTPAYKILESSGPDHAKSFTVEVNLGQNQSASGSGTSKQRAETQAASAALAKYFPD